MSTKEYQAAWRARRGARTGQVGRAREQGCGTAAGYRWHRNHSEPACDACKAAWRDAQRAWYLARRQTSGGRRNMPRQPAQTDNQKDIQTHADNHNHHQ